MINSHLTAMPNNFKTLSFSELNNKNLVNLTNLVIFFVF